MSRRKNKKRNKRSQAGKVVQKQNDAVIEKAEEVSSGPTVEAAPEPEKTIHPLIQKILYTGEYEIVNNNILRKIAGDVGYTINEDFLKKLEDPDFLAKFMPMPALTNFAHCPEIADTAYTIKDEEPEQEIQPEPETIELEEKQEEIPSQEEPVNNEPVEDVVEVEEKQVGPQPDTLQGDLWEIKNLVDEIQNGEDHLELSSDQREKILKHFAYEKALTAAIEDQVKNENYYFNDKGKELLAKILYHTGNLLIDLENVVYFDD